MAKEFNQHNRKKRQETKQVPPPVSTEGAVHLGPGVQKHSQKGCGHL